MAVAIATRAHFFVGLASGDPQDDGIYYQQALDISRHGTAYLHKYAHLPRDFVADPVDQFPFRPLATLPTALVFKIAGPSETAAVVWPLVSSLGTLFAVMRIGTLMASPSSGLIAGLLFAIYPLEVINATRVLAELPLELFCATALLLWIEARQRGSVLLCYLSGLVVGLAYLTKPPALVWFALIAAWAAVDVLRRRASTRSLAAIVVGLVTVVVIEGTFYWYQTGDPFMNLRVHRSAEKFKYEHEAVGVTEIGALTFLYNTGSPLDLTRAVFSLKAGPTDHFGLFYYLFVVSVIYASCSKRCVPLAALGMAVFAYFEFGPVDIQIDALHRGIRYFMLPKQPRFLVLTTPPLVVVAGDFLTAVWRRNHLTMLALVIALTATSLRAAAITSEYYRAWLTDLRTLTTMVRNEPSRVFWGDLWMVEHVRIFSKYRASNLAVLDKRATEDQFTTGCIVLGGSRGAELLSDYIVSTLPEFARQATIEGRPPAGSTLVGRLSGRKSDLRKYDLSVYCYPGTGTSR